MMDNIKKLLDDLKINTYCVDGKCLRKYLCWRQNKFLILLLGNGCSKSCRFCGCGISDRSPQAVDNTEPSRVLEFVKRLNIHRIALTSVTREDLPDYGMTHFANVCKLLRINSVLVKAILPKCEAKKELIELVVKEKPYKIQFGIETVKRLYGYLGIVREDYFRTLEAIKILKDLNVKRRTVQFMLGHGETYVEVLELLRNIREAGANELEIWHYLRTTRLMPNVTEYVKPGVFMNLADVSYKKFGFTYVRTVPMKNPAKVYTTIGLKEYKERKYPSLRKTPFNLCAKEQ